LPPKDSSLHDFLQLSGHPAFWPPVRTGAMSAWWGHVPFAHWFVAELKPRCIVELGTHNGVSFAAFCEAVQRTGFACRCYAVDTWQGDEHAGRYGEDVFADLQPFVAARFGTFAELMRMTFADALAYFSDGFVDLLHIDGLHTYDAVRADFDDWLPKMSQRGVVLFHDINVREREFGVWQLWEELRSAYPSFEFLHGHGLGVLAVGPDIPHAMKILCDLEPDEATAVHDLFSQLGNRWIATDLVSRRASEDRRMDEHRAQTEGLARQVQPLTNRVLELQGEIASQSEWLLTSFARLYEESLHRARPPVEHPARIPPAPESQAPAATPTPAATADGAARRANRALPVKLPRFLRKYYAKLGSARKRSKIGAPTVPPTPSRFEGLSENDAQRIRLAFDNAYYLATYPDVRAANVDPLQHYMTYGWHEGRNPRADFVTSYYLSRWSDIREAGINPFVHWVLHGIDEERRSIPFLQTLEKIAYRPKISAIVPNYNHAKFLPQRIASILAQTYDNIEIIILDDASTDDSRHIIQAYCNRYPDRIRCILNDKNSGGVFYQWQRGVEASTGDLIWICESDDFCEPDFIENLYASFRDMSVMIAFGRILYVDQDGNFTEGLDEYREGAEAGIWSQYLVRPAAEWFANGFGVNNVIANVGGCLFRRFEIRPEIWHEAKRYRVAGDWLLYTELAGGGQIAWNPRAISYFRRHGSNTSAAGFSKPDFYQELERFMLHLRRRWNVPDATVERFYAKLAAQYTWLGLDKQYGPLSRFCSYDKIIGQERQKNHILIAFYGFIPGGGELFPINLANALYEQGWMVSMLGFELDHINPSMRALLNPAIAVYDAEWVNEYGADRFIREAGVSLIHSHTVASEFRFFDQWNTTEAVPYLVTLHGSHEVSGLSDEHLNRIASRVDYFIYTAEKNRRVLGDVQLPPGRLMKLPNAMPLDDRPFPRTRAELGIAEDAVVFTLVARGIPSKGWQASIDAFMRLRRASGGRPMHLLLCGEGEETNRLEALHGNDPDITFLGYQSHIHGLYRLSDVALVPSRFAGESFPLCIIQALQCGCPVIGSDVGEIRSMLAPEGQKPGGIVIPADEDDAIFVDSLAKAMTVMLDDANRVVYSASAEVLSEGYNMENLASMYGEIYRNIISQKDEELSEPDPLQTLSA